MTHRPGTAAPAAVLISALTLVLVGCGSASPAVSEPPSTTPLTSSPATPSPEPATSEPAPTQTPESAEVRLADSSFDPEVLTIGAGTEVVFVNGDDYDHTVTEGTDGRAAEDPFVDADLGQEPVSVTFDEPGTFRLTCRIHPTMNMTITVEG